MALSTSTIASVDYGSPNFSANLSKLFNEKGYVVVNNVFDEHALTQMQSEMAKIVEQMDPDQHPKSVFSTLDEEKHTSDKYFLESVDKIRFFYEEGAFDKENGKLVVPKQRALNKVGHALHWLNPVFKQHSFSEKIQCIIKQIGYKLPKIVQSMYIFKQPCIGGAVTDHVDSTFLQVEPAEHLVGIWIALDDSTLTNGCLWFIPGSHKENQANHYRFVRTSPKCLNSEETTSKGHLVKFVGTRPTYDQARFVPVEVKKGSLVLIDGKVVHKIEAEDTKWSELNWLQESDEYKFPGLFTN
uniref:Phytanoyl-CoA dioxygenase n=1 Tax=Ditylenchus dipsaci TaxID=166011 RepID=A0A915E5T2_9BILA